LSVLFVHHTELQKFLIAPRISYRVVKQATSASGTCRTVQPLSTGAGLRLWFTQSYKYRPNIVTRLITILLSILLTCNLVCSSVFT